MRRRSVISCEMCGDDKGPGNKWLIGWISHHGYALGDWDDGLIERFEATGIDHSCFCGETCALKKVTSNLRQNQAKGTLVE